MTNGKNRYSLRVNGRVVKYYQTAGGARRGMDALYNNGMVLPDDAVTVYDGCLHCNVY